MLLQIVVTNYEFANYCMRVPQNITAQGFLDPCICYEINAGYLSGKARAITALLRNAIKQIST